jgi:DNA-binding NarL/FixJ family response regulator
MRGVNLPFFGYFPLACPSKLHYLGYIKKKISVRIVIVDDHVLLAESIGILIDRQPDLSLAGLAQDGEAGWSLCLDLLPDLAVVDIDLPKLDGLELTKRLRSIAPAIRLLTMSGRIDPYAIWQVAQSGAHGYVEKTENPEILLEAIRTVAAGAEYFSHGFQKVKQEWLAQPDSFQKILSDREQQVLRRVVAGCDDAQIARELEIAFSTVGAHRKHIRQKLALHSDRDLVAYARVWGLDKGGDFKRCLSA